MAQCCKARSCSCQVVAGANVTVIGDGSTAAPYVVSATGGGGGPVTCADVRPCLSEGDGIDYDPATGVISARPSSAAGNQVTFGPDGGLLVPPAAPTPVTCADVRPCLSEGQGIDYDPATGVISARPSTAPGNAVTFGPDGGLLVSPGAVDCDDVRPCISAGDGLTYDAATGVMEARPSTDAGNTLAIGTDGGLLVPPAAPTPVTCADVRPCLSEGQGIDYDPATGVISARPSTAAGNQVTFGPDGGLLVPPATAPALSVGACGLDGDGTAGAPLVVKAEGTWPYACSVDANAGPVYCDSTGALRTEPKPITYWDQQHIQTPFSPPQPVPTGVDNVILTRVLTVTNPDPCRTLFCWFEVEVDVDFDLPAGSGASSGISTDEMTYTANRGSSAATDVHTQVTKVYHRDIPPGATLNEPLDVTMGRGSGGAQYNRIQTFIRVWGLAV